VTLSLDYLSPLPPVRSGISDYSVDLLPHLRELADVRVLRLGDWPLDEEIAGRFEIRDEASSAGEGGRLPLYQMGNNRYHAEIREIAMTRPGVVVLHDLVLHHQLLDRTMGEGEWPPYRDELERCHGWIGEAAAGPLRWGIFGNAAQFELPANRTLLERNRGVIVHGLWAAERLREEDPRLAVRRVPMGIPLPDEASRDSGESFRAARGIPRDAPLLGSFGFQTPIKRTEVAIRALARDGLESAWLLVAGELSPYANFERLAAELGVADRVVVTGFLPFAELGAAISATDLCLNLRYPSAGETSASLLRILAAGRPVIVSDYADFGDLPTEVAIRVPLGDDEEELFPTLVRERLASGVESLRAMGARARAYVAGHHAPEDAARKMLVAATELADLEPPGSAVAEPLPKSSVATSRAEVEIRVDGLEAWRPGERRRLAVTVANRSRSTWLASHEVPGGVIFEVQLWVDGVDTLLGRPWLTLQTPLAGGDERELPLEIRRPLGDARLLIKPKIAVGGSHRPYADGVFDRWL
jgi:glycosyltransferase involved in cell wall biosynthesis